MPPWQKYAAPQQGASPWSKYGQQVGDAYAQFGQQAASPLPPVKDPHSPGYYRALADARSQLADARGGMAPVQAFGNGRSLGFLDEGEAALAALGHGMQRVAPGAFGQPGNFSTGEAYQGARDAIRGGEAQYADKHPILSTGLNIAGGITAPGAMGAARYVTSTPRVIGQIGRGAAVGAAYGGVAGFGNGQGGLAERAGDAGIGALEGGALGGILPGISGALLKPAVRGAADLARRTGQFIAGTDPEAAAMGAPSARQMTAAMSRVQQMMAVKGLKPADLAAAQDAAFGKPITTDEAIGRHAVTEASSLGRRLGAAPDAMEAHYTERAQQAPDRMLGDFADLAGIDPAAAKGDINGLIANRRAAVSPKFDAARATPGPIWNDTLASLAARPSIKKALGQAAGDLLDQGIDPTTHGLAIDPDTGLPKLGEDLGKVTQMQPTAMAWDLAKKRLNGMVERDPFGRRLPDDVAPGNYGIDAANKALTEELRNAIPGYGDALDESGDYLKLQKAFNNGQSMIADPKISAADYADHLGGLSDAERQAHLGGVANKLYDMAQNGRLKPNSFNAPKLRGKMAAALGNDGAQQLLDRAAVEQQMSKFGGKKIPGTGSDTMSLLNASNGPDAAPSFSDAASFVGGMATRPMQAIPQMLDKLAAYSRSAGTTPGYRTALDQLYRQAPSVTAGQISDLSAQGLLRMPAPAFSPGLLGSATGQYADPQYQLLAPNSAMSQ